MQVGGGGGVGVGDLGNPGSFYPIMISSLQNRRAHTKERNCGRS